MTATLSLAAWRLSWRELIPSAELSRNMEASSTTYTVLARRFRPRDFSEVIGQEHVVQLLRNAIRAGRVAHAYLFTGARGVGKTSMARILAKALNCPNAVDAIPCNQCDICENIAAGRDVDVLEIDGASNRGIDDIRQLRANVSVKSMRSVYKIYIIDEVHMLTKEAFNALLKTLEEPPPNVKFVFCTTEPNKIPDTILSRCQRCDFGTIALPQIIARLASIAESEKMEVEPAALELVARRAAGSMRDSQSLFDQLLASADRRITASDVHRLLGTASDERVIGLFDAVIARQRPQALALFGQALSDGAQLGELTDQVLNYVRDLMILSAGADHVPLLSVSESNRETLAKQAQTWGLNTVVAALQIVSEAKLKMQRATFGRALVELALIRLTLLEQLQAINALLTELSTPHAMLAPASGENPATYGGQQEISRLDPSQKKKPEAVTREELTPAAEAPVGSVPVTPAATRIKMPEALLESDEHNVKVSAEVAQPREFLAKISPESISDGSSSAYFHPETESAFWSQLLSDVGDHFDPHLRRVSRVAICGPNRLELGFTRSYLFAKSYCEQPQVRGQLEQAVSRLAGRPVQVAFAVIDDGAADEAAPMPTSARRMDLSTDGDPFVEKVLELFGGKVVKKVILDHIRPEKD